MKFEDVKVGDKVLVPIEEQGLSVFSPRKIFYITKAVTRVTPKQFLIDKDRFQKSDGSNIGGVYRFCRAWFVGEGDKVDQTKELLEYRKRKQLVYAADEALRNLNTQELSNDKLKALLELINN